MDALLRERIDKRKNNLANQLCENLYMIANQCLPVWGQINKLDSVLIRAFSDLPNCQLLYAVECHGIQVSSNIQTDGRINSYTRGQNLSNRPYILNTKPELPFSLSPVYISKTDHKPCITAMHQVVDKIGKTLGCVAADFFIDDLPEEEVELFKSHYWRQIKGDPAIRNNLFSQIRVTSSMDEHIDQVHDIIHNLISKRGIFHAKLHYSSSRATLWPYSAPYEYRLHVLDEIIDPDVCLAYPASNYPAESKISCDAIRDVFNKLKALRNADETIYLRAGSLNIINGMVGLTFSCDGSHYMPVDEFLEKPDSFWFGK